MSDDRLGILAASLIAALAGFISLSFELLWFRVYSFITGDSPVTFGLVLGVYLAGIAVGADVAGRICRGRKALQDSYRWLFRFAYFSSVAAFLTIPTMAAATTAAGWQWLTLLPIMLSATLFGTLLPLISHVGIAPTENAGRRLSWIYFSNIVGCTTGSLVSGFVLLDVLTTQRIALVLAIVGVGLAQLIARYAVRRPLSTPLLFSATAAIFIVATPSLFGHLYERLQFKTTYRGQRFAYVVENKHGVVAVTDSGVTFGGGVYDGRVSTSIVDNRNGIDRAYAVMALRPRYKNVLMIGLSTGAWAQVVANSPFVDRVTVVEINPGYLQLIRRYPQVASLLTNRKVNIVIDDGRRWLVHNRTRRFDLIVSNTTFHFRANSTNLLSAEFMKLVHARLRPSGVFYFNTTGSQDAMRTAFAEFPRGLRVANFIAVSDSTVALDSGRWLRLLTGYRIDGIPLLNLSLPAEQKVLETLSNFPGTVNGIPLQRGLETRESVLARIPTARVVTDDNMLPEWRTLLLDSREESTLRGRH